MKATLQRERRRGIHHVFKSIVRGEKLTDLFSASQKLDLNLSEKYIKNRVHLYPYETGAQV